MTESTNFNMCSVRPSQSASLYKGTILHFCLLIAALILPSTNTASWSLIHVPWTTSVLMIRLLSLIINKSKTSLPHVGLVISCTTPWLRQCENFRVNSGKWHVGNMQLYFQSNTGRFTSPAIQICDEVMPPIHWSDLSKFFKSMASPSSGL